MNWTFRYIPKNVKFYLAKWTKKWWWYFGAYKFSASITGHSEEHLNTQSHFENFDPVVEYVELYDDVSS